MIEYQRLTWPDRLKLVGLALFVASWVGLAIAFPPPHPDPARGRQELAADATTLREVAATLTTIADALDGGDAK